MNKHNWISAKIPPKTIGRYYVLSTKPVPHTTIASFILDMWVNDDNQIISVIAYDENKIGE